MQGRVFTLISTVAAGMSPIGLIIAGPLSDKLGVQTWFLAGGVVTCLMGVVGLLIPAVMHFEDGRKVATSQIPSLPVPVPVATEEFPVENPKGRTPANVDYT